MSFSCPTAIQLPSSAEECKGPAECVAFSLAFLTAKQISSSRGRKISHRGVSKTSLLRHLISHFAKDEAFWSDALDAMTANKIIQDDNFGIPNVQPLYRPLTINQPEKQLKLAKRNPGKTRPKPTDSVKKVKKFERKLKSLTKKRVSLKKRLPHKRNK